MNPRRLSPALAAGILLAVSGCGPDLAGQDPSDPSTVQQEARSVDANAEALTVANRFIAAVNTPGTEASAQAILATLTEDVQHIGVFGRVHGKTELLPILMVAQATPGRHATLTGSAGWSLDKNRIISVTHFDNSFTTPDGQTVTLPFRALRALERQRDGSYLIRSEHTSIGAPLPPPPSAPSAPATDRARTEVSAQELTVLMTSWQDSFNARDLDSLLGRYARDIRFIYAFDGEEGMGRDALRADINGTLAATPDVSVQLLQYDVVPLGDSAAMGLGFWQDSFTGPDGQPVAIITQSSEIFVRSDGDDLWKIRWESTSFAPPPPAP